MDITDVRIKLITDPSDRLKAVCSVTFDESFVVRDVKIVDGTNGLFVAMPSRKLSSSCPTCRYKNPVRSKYCNECGTKLNPQDHEPVGHDGRGKLHRDIAHPITSQFRALLQDKVIESYRAECDDVEDEYPEEGEEAFGAAVEEKAEETFGAAVEEKAEETFGADIEEKAEEAPAPRRDSDDYGAMIADLKGARESSKSSEDRGNRARGPRGGGGGGGERAPRRDDSRGRRGGRGRGGVGVRDDRRAESPPAREPVAEKPEARDEIHEVMEEVHEEPVVEQVIEEVAAKDQVSIEAETAEHAASDSSSDDSTPFGMGL